MTGYCLIICLIAPFIIGFIRVRHDRVMLRKEVKRMMMKGVDRDELVLFRFTAAEASAGLQWKHSKEFEYRGEMYDIVETSVIGDTTFYWCWWDYEETELNRQLCELVDKAVQNDSNRAKNQKNFSFHFKLFFVEVPEEDNSEVVRITEKVKSRAEFKIRSRAISPPGQPPEHVM